MELINISPADLVPMDIFSPAHALRVDLCYAQPAPHSFCGVIYRPGARLWLHKDLAALVVLAARLAEQKYGLGLVLYDGLRTMNAQAAIAQTEIVQAHPHWLEGATRLLSPPGRGAHPRAMAIDLTLERPGTDDGTKSSAILDMGTPFDELATNGTGPDKNRAHRDYLQLGPQARHNRGCLDEVMNEAAARLNLPLLPLPQEWWDFRFPAEIYDRYAPLSDHDLPPQMHMTDQAASSAAQPDCPPDFPKDHFADHFQRISALAARHMPD